MKPNSLKNIPDVVKVDRVVFKRFRRLVYQIYGREAGFIGPTATKALKAYIPVLEAELKEQERQEAAATTPSA